MRHSEGSTRNAMVPIATKGPQQRRPRAGPPKRGPQTPDLPGAARPGPSPRPSHPALPNQRDDTRTRWRSPRPSPAFFRQTAFFRRVPCRRAHTHHIALAAGAAREGAAMADPRSRGGRRWEGVKPWAELWELPCIGMCTPCTAPYVHLRTHGGVTVRAQPMPSYVIPAALRRGPPGGTLPCAHGFSATTCALQTRQTAHTACS